MIVGTDFNLTSEKMCMASMYVNENGAELIGTNIDRTDGKDRLRPSGGSLAKLIQAGSGAPNMTVIGKPDTFGFDLLRK